MKADTFVKLALATGLAVLVAAISYSSGNRWSRGQVGGAKLAPALASGRGQIAAVTVTQGGATLTIEAGKDNRWSLKERGGYPADSDKVRTLLVKLAQAELVDAKTSKPDRYALLELEDPKGKDAKSRGLKLLDAKGSVVLDVIAGKKRPEAFGPGKSGTYVRVGTDPQTWLANAEIEPSADVRSWIKPGVLETDEAKIASATIEIAGEEPLKIERGEGAGAKAAFIGLPDGKKLKDEGAASGILRAAASFEADDVRKLASAPAGEGVSTVRLETRDGLELVLRLRKDGDAHWLSISASGKAEAGTKAAEAIQARTAGWEFKLPAGKADALLKRRADLFQAS